MTEDRKELIEYLDVKFAKIDARFDVLERTKVDKSDLDGLLKDKADKSDVAQILENLDAYAKQTDTYFQEHILLAGQVARHGKWHEEAAKKLGMKLEY